ncbi:MAG: hypothetical protein WCK55_04105 [Verrucomicrobiota bacterium]
MKNYTAIIAVALSLPVGFANAQQRDERPPGPPLGEGRPPIERPFGGTDRADMPPMQHVPPFFAALDKNGDGVISEDEIAAASESLRKFAAERGGKLTLQTLLGPPPQDMHRDGFRPPGAPPDGQPPRGNFNAPRDGQREDGGTRRIAPQPDGPRDGEPRREGAAPPRDGVRPEGRAPQNGDRPPGVVRPRDGKRGGPRGDAPREGAPPDGAPKPEARGPRDSEAPRNADRPRDDEPRREGDKPRGDRSPGDAPKPDGEPRRPNPEG